MGTPEPPQDAEKGPPRGVLAVEAASDRSSVESPKKGDSATSSAPPVSYWKLYSTADWLDWVLIVLGVIGALANGGCCLELAQAAV
jgi:hypothetical protein